MSAKLCEYKPLFLDNRLIYFEQYNYIYGISSNIPLTMNPIILIALLKKYFSSNIHFYGTQEECVFMGIIAEILNYNINIHTPAQWKLQFIAEQQSIEINTEDSLSNNIEDFPIIVSYIPMTLQATAKKQSLTVSSRDDWKYQPKPWHMPNKTICLPNPNDFNWQKILSNPALIDNIKFYQKITLLPIS